MFSENYTIRAARPEDHGRIINVLPDWWGGRDLTSMVPKVFLLHFHSTSIIVEQEDQLIAFLIGFDSQSYQDESYIHFVGIHPDHRGKGLGKYLYQKFFERVIKENRLIVRACTSPVNIGSVEFHKKLGFVLEEGGGEVGGIPVFLDYNKPGDHKVRFLIKLKKG